MVSLQTRLARKRHRKFRLWVNPRCGKGGYVKWNAYSHEILKPNALRNYNRRNFEELYPWPGAIQGKYGTTVREMLGLELPIRRPVCKDPWPFEYALYVGLQVRFLNRGD